MDRFTKEAYGYFYNQKGTLPVIEPVPPKMTDADHANKIRSLVAALNDAIWEARKAKLKVDMASIGQGNLGIEPSKYASLPVYISRTL